MIYKVIDVFYEDTIFERVVLIREFKTEFEAHDFLGKHADNLESGYVTTDNGPFVEDKDTVKLEVLK